MPRRIIGGALPNMRSGGSTLEPCCQASNILSCQPTTVDPTALGSTEDLEVEDVVLAFANTVPPHGFHYTNAAGDEALITLNPTTQNMFGSLKTISGRSFALEKCKNSHMWIEYNVTSFKPEILEHSRTAMGDRKVMDLSSNDNTTEAVYSIMFYYTPEFAQITPDITGFIDDVLAETNQGYRNSKVKLTAIKHCVEEATIHDNARIHGSLLNAFASMKSSITALRNTADAAVLLVANYDDYCGLAWGNTISSGSTLSVTKKSCALGHYTFGHELGHSMGLQHNPETGRPSYYPGGHGHIIEAGNASHGVRSIMAYAHPTAYHPRVLYYSNPDVVYPATGTPTGVAGVSDNAAVLMRNRFDMQRVGDESGSCNTLPPTSSPLTTSTSEPTSESGSITSPNYPNNYDDNVNKKYPLVVASGSRIELEFEDFVLEESVGCEWDYLEIFDTDESRMLARCGTDKPHKTTSTGNKMFVRFRSDRSVTAKGFKANWRAV